MGTKFGGFGIDTTVGFVLRFIGTFALCWSHPVLTVIAIISLVLSAPGKAKIWPAKQILEQIREFVKKHALISLFAYFLSGILAIVGIWAFPYLPLLAKLLAIIVAIVIIVDIFRPITIRAGDVG